MEPLDLTKTPPRSAQAELAGIVFLPRTIDKVRASLPGGNLGEYTIPGFSSFLLGVIGVELDEFTKVVADAKTDDEVGAFVSTKATPDKIALWNKGAKERPLYQGNREEALAEHPWLADHPADTTTLQFLDLDDARAFAAK